MDLHGAGDLQIHQAPALWCRLAVEPESPFLLHVPLKQTVLCSVMKRKAPFVAFIPSS